MSTKTLLCLWVFTFWSFALGAQFDQEEVFPDLYGEALQAAVQQAYTPATVLNYARARDTLFGTILRKNDSLSCFYSGHRVYMDPAEDPTTTVFQNGGTNGINTEHLWPQAYGAGDGPPRSNMYHLFPTRIRVNEARSNLPFAEIVDSETQAWYYLNQSQSNIPNNFIERYSEFRDGAFEPREDFKGDVARAMFYFYTIYRNEAQAAPANFFASQATTLYQWHLQDPVDEAEWLRNQRIAPYQSNRSNPFILDPTLIERAYCVLLQQPCSATSTRQPSLELPLRSWPNPFQEQFTLTYELPAAGQIQWSLFQAQGQLLWTSQPEWQNSGAQQFTWSNTFASLPAHGVFWLRLQWSDGTRSAEAWQRMVRIATRD